MLAELTPEQLKALQFSWPFWARPNQLAPTDREWSIWLMLAGRGFGKTRAGAEWVRSQMCGATPLTGGTCSHMAIIAETAADARDVMVGDGKSIEEASGILQVHPKDFMPIYNSSLRRLTWPNGAIATIYNATEPDQLRGPQHGKAWCDELAKWRYAEDTWTQLQFGLRIGARPQVCITTTPKPIKLLKEIMADPDTYVVRGSTTENKSNLSPFFMRTIVRKYEGSRIGRQELEGELLEDIPGALWARATIDALRVTPPANVTTPRQIVEWLGLVRIVVAIDPAATSGEDADETGLLVEGIDKAGIGYVLEDKSARYTPTEWATEAIALYKNWHADLIVAEVNNGGEMVENTVRMVDPNVSYKSVHASKGKVTRAEPISALYEQRRVRHVGSFALLEDQMCGFTTNFDRKSMGYSPDRIDALVWGFSELMVEEVPGWGVMEHYRRESEAQSIVKAALGRAINGTQATPVIAPAQAGTKMKAPPNISTAYGMLGDKYQADNEGYIYVQPHDVGPLRASGFQT